MNLVPKTLRVCRTLVQKDDDRHQERNQSFQKYRIVDVASPPINTPIRSPAESVGLDNARSVENHSNSMNMPFQNMDLHQGSPQKIEN